jgi:hypothetical protein
MVNVCAFASLLFEIAVGGPDARLGAAPPIPASVSAIIEEGRSPLNKLPIICNVYRRTASRFCRALTLRKVAPLPIRLTRLSRERKGNEHDHSVQFESARFFYQSIVESREGVHRATKRPWKVRRFALHLQIIILK